MSVKPARIKYWGFKLRAIVLLVAGRRESAVGVFSEMLRLWPFDAYALSSRSHVLAQLGRREGAIRDAQALVDAQPRRSAADWFNLAFLLEEAGRIEEAEQAFRRALELDPKLDRAWYGLGLVLIKRQRFEEAIKALKRNTELQPMSPYGWYQLARVHMDRQDPDAVRQVIAHLKGFEPQVAAQLERETRLAVR